MLYTWYRQKTINMEKCKSVWLSMGRHARAPPGMRDALLVVLSAVTGAFPVIVTPILRTHARTRTVKTNSTTAWHLPTMRVQLALQPSRAFTKAAIATGRHQ